MQSVDLKVTLIAWTGSVYPAYLAARTCYNRENTPAMVPDCRDMCKPGTYDAEELLALVERLEEEEMTRWLREKVLNKGHIGILEHLYFTFHIAGVSRILTHQLVRHRHFSFAQRNYHIEPLEECVVPPAYAGTTSTDWFCDMVDEQFQAYQEDLKNSGFFCKTPVSREEARYLLPPAIATNLVLTGNARTFVEASHKRLCMKASWEIRRLFEELQRQILCVCPLVAEYMDAPCHTCKEKPCATDTGEVEPWQP